MHLDHSLDRNLRIPRLLCLQRPCSVTPGHVQDGHFPSEALSVSPSHSQLAAASSELVSPTRLPSPSAQLNFLKIHDYVLTLLENPQLFPPPLPTFHKTSVPGMKTPHTLAPTHLSELIFCCFRIHTTYFKNVCVVTYFFDHSPSMCLSGCFCHPSSKKAASTTVPFLMINGRSFIPEDLACDSA